MVRIHEGSGKQLPEGPAAVDESDGTSLAVAQGMGMGIDAEGMVERAGEVFGADGLVDRPGGVFVGAAEDDAAANAGAGEHAREAVAPVVPAVLLAATVVALSGCQGAGASRSPDAAGSAKAGAQPDDAGTVIRLSGTVEAVRASTVIVPRLAGQATNSLVITYLVPPGTKVASGDLLVQFDPPNE